MITGICLGFIWLKNNAEFITSLLEGDPKSIFLEVLLFIETSLLVSKPSDQKYYLKNGSIQEKYKVLSLQSSYQLSECMLFCVRDMEGVKSTHLSWLLEQWPRLQNGIHIPLFLKIKKNPGRTYWKKQTFLNKCPT